MEVIDLIYSLDPNHDGQISFEEFKEVLKHIEERLGANQ
jgi:Ca2+-binding EF-hand superfamily protein